ncbi:MAG: protein-L-isoaspartate(D-aspartate) O-methyltransferase [Verrucomicrobiota bacterium]
MNCEALINTLRGPNFRIEDERVLEALTRVPREAFVPEALKDRAWENRPLPIGENQTISQPYIVAFMTQALALEPGHRVLEIGAGSGYQAAILADLVREVHSLEILEHHAALARARLADLGFDNVTVYHRDGHLGLPEGAPFDRIIVTCAARDLPHTLTEQLSENGRLIIPMGNPGEQQNLLLYEKKNGQLAEKHLLPVVFVPMTGG